MDTIKVCSLFDVPPCKIAAMERATFDNIDCPVLDSLDYACMMMESHTALIPLHLDKMAAGTWGKYEKVDSVGELMEGKGYR